jgi:hypothetical protein
LAWKRHFNDKKHSLTKKKKKKIKKKKKKKKKKQPATPVRSCCTLTLCAASPRLPGAFLGSFMQFFECLGGFWLKMTSFWVFLRLFWVFLRLFGVFLTYFCLVLGVLGPDLPLCHAATTWPR